MNICIVIPLYNEAFRFRSDILAAYAKSHSVHFYLVNDGSTDGTKALIDTLNKESELITVLHLHKNVGKAEAIRAAILEATTTGYFSHIGYFDADFATPLAEIENFKTIVSNLGKPFVMGTRIKRLGANVKRYPYRHFSGRLVATIISEFILKLPVYDTQCGAKLIENHLAAEIFKNPFKTKWLFDVELIMRVKKKYGKAYCLENIYELPLQTWVDNGHSKLKFMDFLKTPFLLFKLYRNQ